MQTTVAITVFEVRHAEMGRPRSQAAGWPLTMRVVALGVVLEWVMQLPCPLRYSLSSVLLLGALRFYALGGFGTWQPHS